MISNQVVKIIWDWVMTKKYPRKQGWAPQISWVYISFSGLDTRFLHSTYPSKFKRIKVVQSSRATWTIVLIFKKEREKECTISALLSFYYYYWKEIKYLELDQKSMRYSNEEK